MVEWMNGLIVVVSAVVVVIGKDVVDNYKIKKRNGSSNGNGNNPFSVCSLHETIIEDLIKGREIMGRLSIDVTEVKNDVKWLIKEKGN
jgi:hypothetical protein